MKHLIYPFTNRAHVRQQKLIEELSKEFIIDVWKPNTTQDVGMEAFSILCAVEFNNYIASKKYDGAIIRADRFELLHLAGICAYKGIPIVHLEAGADSGLRVIDTKIRDAISQLADFYFVTDTQAQRKVIYLGANPDKVFNVGSLDVSYANSIVPKRLIEEPYILLLHHTIPNEDTKLVYQAVEFLGYKIVGVKSNRDYGKSLMSEEYSPEDFISLLNFASCFVSNSSAACKEASILGTPVCLVGSRQDGRIAGRNAIRVIHDEREIVQVTKFQLSHGRYSPDFVYYKPYTEVLIANKLKEIL